MRRQIADYCRHYPKGVPDGHKCDAKLVLIGEAGGGQEELAGVPFVGRSGWQLRKWWETMGLSREDFYITNVLEYRPNDDNDITQVPAEDLAAGVSRLRARLRDRTLPTLAVPTGNTALRALTGLDTITKWRGSVLQAELWDTPVKCIPTIHPAHALRSPVLSKVCYHDWLRIAQDRKFKELRLPQRRHIINPTKKEIAWFEKVANGIGTETGAHLFIDIETSWEGTFLIGFAPNPFLSISVPYPDEMDFIRRMCALPCAKGIQNNGFDTYHLAWDGVEVENVVWDPSVMFYTLDCNAGPTNDPKFKDEDNPFLSDRKSTIKPYSLAFMSSVFTREPYWKDESKEEGEFVRRQGGAGDEWWDRFQTYNGKDCCVSHEIVGNILWLYAHPDVNWWEVDLG